MQAEWTMLMEDTNEERLEAFSKEEREEQDLLQQSIQKHHRQMRDMKKQRLSLDEEIRNLETKLQDDYSRRQLFGLYKERNDLLKKQENLLRALKHGSQGRRRGEEEGQGGGGGELVDGDEGSSRLKESFRYQRGKLIEELEDLGKEVKEIQDKKEKAKETIKRHTIRTEEIKRALQQDEKLDETEKQKMQFLSSKDDEMSTFIERYTDLRVELEAAQKRLEGEIKEEEEQETKLQSELENVPTSEEMQKILASIEKKKKEVEVAQEEVKVLKQNVEEKTKDLDRERNLESLLQGKDKNDDSKRQIYSPETKSSLDQANLFLYEIRELEERDEKMREEIREKFEKKEDLRALVEREKRELAETEKRLRSQLEEAREKAESLEAKKTEVLRSLRENAAHQRLEVLDAELERGHRTVAELQKVVDEEKKKCDPNVIKAVCLSLADQVNDKLKDLAKQRRQNERESILRDGKMCSLLSYGLA
ncbi:intraflagellar transport component ift74 72 protein [Cystoisospora suis]|uniref:Intraflagellar transport component ift74 72 protein n=1 Tax=Cystoisospora suis TaxID=483139 RepID=A0A2C6LC55_9APIC|nr:intraflagellar transport component ift74 72 protein [Cystoisospora suis]